MEGQISTLTDIDTKASRILRVNILLIGAIISALSIAAQLGDPNEGIDVLQPFVNVYTKLGVASLVLSTALAALTYTASELDVGMSAENMLRLLDAEFPESEYRELVVKNYIVRINFNHSTNLRNIPLVTATIVFVVGAVLLFSLGIYEAMIAPVPPVLNASAVVLIVVVTLISGSVKQTWRAVQDVWEWR